MEQDLCVVNTIIWVNSAAHTIFCNLRTGVSWGIRISSHFRIWCLTCIVDSEEQNLAHYLVLLSAVCLKWIKNGRHAYSYNENEGHTYAYSHLLESQWVDSSCDKKTCFSEYCENTVRFTPVCRKIHSDALVLKTARNVVQGCKNWLCILIVSEVGSTWSMTRGTDWNGGSNFKWPKSRRDMRTIVGPPCFHYHPLNKRLIYSGITQVEARYDLYVPEYTTKPWACEKLKSLEEKKPVTWWLALGNRYELQMKVNIHQYIFDIWNYLPYPKVFYRIYTQSPVAVWFT